jgi:hypothetical protein
LKKSFLLESETSDTEDDIININLFLNFLNFYFLILSKPTPPRKPLRYTK